jgi:hypothetical protein
MRYIALCLALAAASPLASAGCLPIIGTVKLTLDQTPERVPICTVATIPGMQGQHFMGPGACYKNELKLVGLPAIHGYSGVTSEAISGSDGGVTSSPAGVQGNRTIWTARSTFSLLGTRFYTAEVIIDTGNGLMVTEQSVITNTDHNGSLFKNATGGFTILGNSIGETAQVRGHICTP